MASNTLQPTLRGPGGRIPTPKIHPWFPQVPKANANVVVNRQGLPLPNGPIVLQATNDVNTETHVLSLFD